ncbi:MAG: hypothetical protein K940chlam7_01143 [Chlamydiae bacterium]|nr:hypothetical protein [Chlamydiota bacterium]
MFTRLKDLKLKAIFPHRKARIAPRTPKASHYPKKLSKQRTLISHYRKAQMALRTPKIILRVLEQTGRHSRDPIFLGIQRPVQLGSYHRTYKNDHPCEH